MRSIAATLALLFVATSGGVALAEMPSPVVPIDPTWRLAFGDDFDTLSLRTGGPDEVGVALGKGTWTARWPWARDAKGSWPNGSEYAWFPDPAYPFGGGYPPTGQFSVKDSVLTIRAERTPPSMVGKEIDVTGNTDVTTKRKGYMFPWISGAITTFDTFSVSGPAYFEGRLKVPKGRSAWTAFWLLTKNWRSRGHSEIDMPEIFNDRTDVAEFTVTHGCGSVLCAKKAERNYRAPVDLSLDFHVYSCLRTKTDFIFFLDGAQAFKTPIPGDDFEPDQLFIILSLQVGSDLGYDNAKPPNKTTPNPMSLQVDYIRVWAPPTPSAEGKAARNEKDYPSTLDYLRDQAAHGDGYAARVLAVAYDEALGGVDKHGGMTLKWALVGAELGQPDAQLMAATFLANGWGAPIDQAGAARWYRVVAETEGWPEAEFRLGEALAHGLGVKPDKAEAVKWLKRAAAENYPGAREFLATLNR